MYPKPVSAAVGTIPNVTSMPSAAAGMAARTAVWKAASSRTT